MARKPRLEVEGGLYHLITRGVERRDIFHAADDYRKFLSLLAVQKEITIGVSSAIVAILGLALVSKYK
ncbi:MAG: hypothetical protein ACK4S4_07790 [Pyrinomonadaceae bacterium]